MHKMFVRVRTPRSKRKNVVRVGGEVTLRCMPGNTPVSRVDGSTRPVLAAVRSVNGRKMATVEYKDSVDGETHLVEVPPSSLQGGDTRSLSIGDKVVVVKTPPGVCVSVGSHGTVLGGEEVYTVSFEMTHSSDGEELANVVTVTQDQVPREALRFEGEKSEEESEEPSSDDSEASEVEAEELVGGSSPNTMMRLKQQLAPEVLEEVTLMLNLDELEDLSSTLEGHDNPRALGTEAVLNVLLD
jgi:hypothetical protein